MGTQVAQASLALIKLALHTFIIDAIYKQIKMYSNVAVRLRIYSGVRM